MKPKVVPELDQRPYVQWQKDFILKDNLLFLNITPANSLETISVFVVPARKHQATIDGCYRSAGHQGRDRTLSLMKERFWWPGMAPAAPALYVVPFGCFPASGNVLMENGRSVTMSELQIGDQVQRSSHSSETFCKIYI